MIFPSAIQPRDSPAYRAAGIDLAHPIPTADCVSVVDSSLAVEIFLVALQGVVADPTAAVVLAECSRMGVVIAWVAAAETPVQ